MPLIFKFVLLLSVALANAATEKKTKQEGRGEGRGVDMQFPEGYLVQATGTKK